MHLKQQSAIDTPTTSYGSQLAPTDISHNACFDNKNNKALILTTDCSLAVNAFVDN